MAIKEWLVKTAGEVRGPFSFDEIVEQIQSKEIILVDEIAKSFGRWRYVRDETVFEKVVLELQNREALRGEKTFTHSDTDAITLDVTEHVLNFSSASRIQNQIQEHFERSGEKNNSTSKPAEDISAASTKSKESSAVESVPSYAFEQDRSLKKENLKNNRMRIFGSVILIASVACFFLFQKKNVYTSYEDKKKIAMQLFEYGQFLASKEAFEKLTTTNPSDDESRYFYAFNLLQLSDTLIAERSLLELKSKNSRYQAQVLNLLGIIQLKNYNLKEALSYFDEALKISPQSVPVFFNKGIVDFLENRFQESHQNFSKAMIHGGLDGVILLMNIELLINNGRQILSDAELIQSTTELQSLILKHLQSFEIYKQELLIGLAVIHHFLKNTDGVSKAISQAVNIDPDLTQNHIFDISFYRDVMTWNRIHGWIQFLKEAYPQDKNLMTLYGYSLFKGTEKIEGKSYLEGRLEPTFSHPVDAILNAYILLTLGREAEATAALTELPQVKWNSIAYNLMAKIHFNKKDYLAARKDYEAALLMDRGNIVSLAGLAKTFLNLGNEIYAQDAIHQAYKISPYFKPTLELRYQTSALSSNEYGDPQ